MFPKKANILKPLLEWISQRALCLLADVLGWLERCWESSPSKHLTKLNWTDCKSSVLQMEMAQEILCEKEEGIFVLLIVILYNELLSSKCLYCHFLFPLTYTSPPPPSKVLCTNVIVPNPRPSLVLVTNQISLEDVLSVTWLKNKTFYWLADLYEHVKLCEFPF